MMSKKQHPTTQPEAPLVSHNPPKPPIAYNALMTAALPFCTRLLKEYQRPTLSSTRPLKPKQQQKLLVKHLQLFEAQAQTYGYSDPIIQPARALLAAWADELLLHHYAGWNEYRLLSTEKEQQQWSTPEFFTMIKEHLSPDNLDWLELAYVTLSLGFKAHSSKTVPHDEHSISSPTDQQPEITTETLYNYIQAQRKRQLGPLPPPMTHTLQSASEINEPSDTKLNTRQYPYHRLLPNRLWVTMIILAALSAVITLHHWTNQQITKSLSPLLINTIEER